MTFDCFDVVIVPFPFTERTSGKRRPAVILSSIGFSAETGHVVAAMVTSARQSSWPTDVNVSDLDQAGLSNKCVVRFKLFTLDASLVIRKAGQLCDTDKRAVSAAIKTVLPALQ